MRANAYMNKGDYDSAIMDYTEIIELFPEVYGNEGYFKRGRAYKAKGDYERAIADFEKATSISSDSEFIGRVQGELEKAFSLILGGEISVTGQGRTDAGVHAEEQAAHTVLESVDVDLKKLRKSLNGLLKPDCTVKELVMAPESFHARYSAIARHYRYR